MRRNHLLLPLLLCSVLAVACAATADDKKKFVRVITEPKPGEEYVSIHTAKPASGVQGKSPESDIDVNVQDEGQTGIKDVTGPIPTEEKIYAHKKLYPSIDNEDGPRRTTKPEKKHDVRIGGVTADEIVAADGVATKPNKDKTRETVAKTHVKTSGEDDGLYDFVDSPYGGQIVGAASSQASRINIKKAPNGQEYEYEYVYYYYDEDDEHSKPATTGSKTGQTSTAQPSQQTTSQQQHGPQNGPKANNKDAAGSKSKKPPVVQDENQFVQNNKGRFSSVVTTDEPEGHSNFAVNDIAEHSSKTKESGRNLEEALSVPSSSPSVSEERLPHNPRFPSRPRGNSKPTQEFATTVIPATDTPITRIRASNVHQPGLDLVDSNAFRTHSSNNGQLNAWTSPRHEINNNRDAVVQTTTSAAADQVATTIINNAYNTQPTDTVPSATETVSLDRNQDDTDADAKGLSTTTILTPDEVVAVTTQRYTAGPTDKGAVDLYAILQQARSEETANTIASPGEQHATRFDDGDTQFPTTTQRLVPTATTATTTTTTTTTTPAPATTTTTTTVAAPTRQFHGPAAGPVRGRYRGNGANRHASSTAAAPTTTTTVEPSATPDEVTERRKFKPTRERNTQGSVYSKRYQSSTAAFDKDSSTTESEAVVTKAQKPSFGRQRTRASKPVSSTLPIDETVEVTSAAPKPNFAERSNLRRQNSRNKFTTSGSTTTTTTTAAAPQAAEEEEGAEHDVSETTSTTTARPVGSRLRPNIRPLRPGLRLNFGGKGSTTTVSTTVPSTTQPPAVESSPDATGEKEPVQQEPASPTPTPDSLSRLKNRSRFRAPEKQSAALAPKQQTLAPPAGNRKHLLSNLLPKKKSIVGPTEEPSAAAVEDARPASDDERPDNGRPAASQNDDDAAAAAATDDDDERPSSHAAAAPGSTTTEAPASSTNRLSSLLAKRRPLQRRPADLQHQQHQQQSGGKQSNQQQEE